MKTGIFLLGALIVTCAVTFLNGRKPDSGVANGAQDYGCAVIAVNMATGTGALGMAHIPIAAVTLLEIDLWVRDRWHRFWGETIDRQECVFSADSHDR